MIEIRHLYKAFDNHMVLRNLNMKINEGAVYGFVGPNGAGKTTTMRIIAGLLKADSGQILIDGEDIDARHKELIGYMPDFFGVYDNLKAIEYMEFYASIYGMYGKQATSYCMELMDLVHLSDKANFYVDSLSRGMKQRLCLARSLVHNPQLLILDEPASGLDPRARFEMKGILKNLHEIDKTIIISSHILSELAEMCTTIGIIDHGQMMVKGTVDEIMTRLNTSNPLQIRIVEGMDQAVKILKENPTVVNLSVDANMLLVGFKGNEEEEAALLASLIQNDVRVSSFVRDTGNLEEVFMRVTGNKEVLSA